MKYDGERVHTHFVPGPEHVGFKQVIHGGILATLLDEVMAWACIAVTRDLAYCAEFTVRFVEPAKPGDELTATAWLTANRRRMFETAAEVKNSQGKVIATATGKYLPIKGDIVAEMATDLVGDTTLVQKLPPDSSRPDSFRK